MSPNRLSPIFLQSTPSRKSPRKTMNKDTETALNQTTSVPQSDENAKPTESQPAPTTTPDMVPPPTLETSTIPQPTTAREPSATPLSEPSTTPSESSHSTRPEGPLSSLAHKAAETQFGRAANQKMPESVRPTLDRASRVLNSVDEHLLAARDTLDTDEGRRVLKSACEFAYSLLAFFSMLFTASVSSAERKLKMQPADESSPKRFVKVCREAAKRVRTRTEAREKQVDGSCEAWIYAHARQAMDLIFSVFKTSLKGLSEFSGPGKQYVAGAANNVISILPEDMQTDVRESPGPVESLRSGLKCAGCNAASDSCAQTSSEETDTGHRMKVD